MVNNILILSQLALIVSFLFIIYKWNKHLLATKLLLKVYYQTYAKSRA